MMHACADVNFMLSSNNEQSSSLACIQGTALQVGLVSMCILSSNKAEITQGSCYTNVLGCCGCTAKSATMQPYLWQRRFDHAVCDAQEMGDTGDAADVVDEQLWGDDKDKHEDSSKAEEKYEKDAPIQVPPERMA